jgi:radical SAM/Cys-rich protein
MSQFERKVLEVRKTPLQSLGLESIQVSVILNCNQQCTHCHVSAGPGRFERMESATMERVRELAKLVNCQLVEITGGAPELHPLLRNFIHSLRTDGFRVRVLTNLTVFNELNTESYPEFYRDWQVEVAASLPGYTEASVRAQRGEGVFARSISALWRLNALGYGLNPRLPLTLVYNPAGAFLPPEPAALEASFRRELEQRFGIQFNTLQIVNNLPIGNFLHGLRRQNQEHAYRSLIQNAFNPEVLDRLYCRRQLSVGWDGTLYDCDFNLALSRPIAPNYLAHIRKIYVPALQTRTIRNGDHCFACTAAQGNCRLDYPAPAEAAAEPAHAATGDGTHQQT